jgi:pectinesterase
MKIQEILAPLLFGARCLCGESSNSTLSSSLQSSFTIFPANRATDVNPDTHLVLTFSRPPKVGRSGTIRVYDAKTNAVVDSIDMRIPTSPNPSGRAPGSGSGATKAPGPADPRDKTAYQVNIVGGMDFHFFPIIVRGNLATIALHNNVLKYGRTYAVRMDPGVLVPSDGTFKGFSSGSWEFSTKAAPPSQSASRFVVAADGSGDFNTLQGAIDFVPTNPAKKVTIYVKNGHYEEIIFINRKSNLIIRGQDRGKVVVGYPNNSAFNPAKAGPSRRVAFTINNGRNIQLSSFTINNYFIGQAEAVLVRGERIIIDRMNLNGSGDAFTTYGTIYFVDSKLTGDGDTVLGYGAVFFLRSEIDSIGPVTWTRTVAGSHGNIFVNSTIIGVDKPLPWSVTASNPAGKKSKSVFARLPQNGRGSTANFPNAEMVLINVKTNNIPAEGWGPIQSSGFDTSKVHFWEYNTMDLNGRPVNMARRHKVAKQLRLPQDAKTISDYSNPSFILKGWTPVVE